MTGKLIAAAVLMLSSIQAFGQATTTTLGGLIGLKSGPQNARVWPFIVGNNGPDEAMGTQLTSIVLTQTRGTACTPVIMSTFPVQVGNIAPGATATGNVTIDFTGCPAAATFLVTVSFSANSGAATGSISKMNQFQ